MAGNRQQFTLQFNADTSQAKKSIQELNNALQNLQKAQSNSGFADLGINKAVESAEELTKHLNKALNVDTGKLNLSAFQNSLQASNTSLKSLTNDLLKAGTVGQQAFLAMAGAIAQAEVPLRQTNKTIKDLAQTLKNTIKWEISSTTVHSLESALSGAVSYVKDLNSSLNNIRIVTGQSAEDMVKFAQQANRAARELSTTTKAYSDASLIYYQQGDSAEQAAKKAAITIKAANSSFNTSAAEMSEYLTAVWNSYQVGADELERYVDIMAALGAKTATSLEEIATSMQKVAATANTVGVSMEQVSSIISTVSSVTRESAESIGTSYKTIFARIGDLKFGEALDDGTTLGQVSSQLDKIGVKILDANGEMRDMGTIIEDLGSKWQTMSQAQKTAIAQVVAGKRQYTQLMALFENWDMYQNNMNIAQNAEGSLENMYKIQAESVEASSARMRAALENLYSKFINDTSIIKFTENITKVVDAISSVIDAFGGLPGILGNIGAIAIKVFSKDISGGIDKTLAKLTTFTSQFTGKNTFKEIAKNGVQSTQQIEQQKAMTQARVAIEEQKKGVFNESGRFAVNEAAELLSYKEQLLSIQHQLTDAQKEEAQAALNNLSQQQAEIIKLKADKEQMQKDEVNSLRKDKQAILREHSGTNALGVEHAFQSSTEKQKHINEQIKLQYIEGKSNNYYGNLTKADVSSIDAMLQKSKELGVQLEKTDQALEMIRGQLRSGDIQQTEAEFDALKGKIEQLLGKKLEANTLDDLRKELQQIGNEALSTQEQLEDLVRNTTDAIDEVGVGKKFSQALQNSFERGQESASLDFELNIKTSSLEKAKQKIKDALNPKSATYSKIAEGMTKVASATGSLIAGLSTGGNLLRTMTDEASSLGDKLNSVAGGVSTLISGFATGGWIGLAASAIGMIISGFSQMQKQEEEAEKKRKQERAEYAQNETNALLNEQSTIESLIQEYYTLEDSKKVLTNPDYVQSVLDLTTALTGEVTTVQTLIAEYGNLDTAIENMRLQNLRDTRTELAAGLNPSLQGEETDFITSGEVAGNAYYALSNGAIANIDGAVRRAYTNTLTSEDSGNIMQKALEAWIQEGIDNPPSFDEGSNEQLFESLFGTETSEGLGIEFTDFFSYAKWILKASLEDAAEQNTEWDLGFFYDMLNENLLHVFGESYGGNNYIQTMVASMTESMVKQFGDTNAQTHFGSIIPWQIGQYASINSEGYVLDNPFEDENALQSLYKTLNIANMGETTAGVGDTGSLPDDISSWLEELSLGIWTGPEELLSFYERGKDLMSKYPELKTNTTFTDWFNGLSYLENYSEVMSQLKEIDLEVGLADNENFKATTLTKMTEYADFSQAMDSAIEYLVTEQGYTEESAHQAIAKLIQSWGVVPELANDFNTIIGLANFIAEQNPEANPEEVRSHLEAFYNEYGREVFSTVNFGQIQYTPGQGFDQTQLKDAVAYGRRKTEIDASNKNKAGAQALLDLSDEEIAALSPEQWDKIAGEIDWGKRAVDGFNVETEDDWLALTHREDREKYLQGIIDAENAAMVGEQGLLKTLATETEAYAASLQQTYDAAQTEDSAYQQAKASIEKNQNALKGITDEALKSLKFDAPETIQALSDYYTQEEIKILEEYAKSLNTSEGPTEQQKTAVSLIRNQRQQQIDSNASYVSYIEGLPSIITGLNEEAQGYREQEGFLARVSNFTDEDAIDTFGNSIKVVTDNVSNLQNEFNALNSIDVSKVPAAGTQAYDALSTSLEKAGKTMSDYKRMSEKDRIKALSQAKQDSLKVQRDKQKEIEDAYATKYGFNEETTYADILATGDQNQINAYNAWINAQQEYANLTDQIIQEDQNRADQLIQVGAANTEAAIARFEQEQAKLQDAAEKMMEVSNILSSHIDGSELTFAERAKLDPAVLAQWDALTSNTERANFAAQQTAEAYQKQMEYQQKINDGIAMAESRMKYIGKDSELLLSNTTNFKTSEAFANWMDITSLSDAAKSALKEADAIVRPTLGDSTTYSKWAEAMRDQLKLMGEEGSSALALLEAKGKDTMSNIFKDFSKQLRDQAQEAVNAWLKAFNDISEAKQKLFKGENILEDLINDPTKIIEYANATNKSVNDFVQALLNGQITADNFTNTPQFDINRAKAQYNLDLTSYGGYNIGTKGVIYDKRALLKANGKSSSDIRAEDYEIIEPALREFYKNILTKAQLQDENGRLYNTDELINKIISGDTDAYSILQQAIDVVNQQINAEKTLTEVYNKRKEFEAAITGAYNQSIKIKEEQVVGGSGNQEELTKLQAALQNAQTEKNKEDGKWENLAEADRQLLESYGITSFDQVDSAAVDCATALSALATAAYEAAKAQASQKAKEAGYYEKDGLYYYDEEFENPVTEINDLLKQYKDSADQALYNISDVKTENINGLASSVGMTRDEFEAYTQAIYDNIGALEDWSSLSEEAKKPYYDLAKEIAEAENAFKDLQSISKDTWKQLKSGANKGSADYIKSIQQLKKNMSKIFHTDMKYITDDFVENHLDQMEKMANGTKKEAMIAQDAIEDDLVKAVMEADGTTAAIVINVETGEAESALTYLQNALDQWDGEEFGFTIHADTEGAQANVIASLNSILSAGQMTADQITAALNAIGWEPEITWKEYTGSFTDAMQAHGYVKTLTGYEPIGEEIEGTYEGKYYLPVIGSAHKNTTPGGGPRPTGNKGGGGGSKPKTLDKKKPEDEKERYHYLEQQLKRLTESFTEIDKLKDRTYGNKHLKNLEQEISLLKEQLDVQRDYIKAAKAYLAIDQQRVASLSATFDADGNITNYEEVMDSIIGKYNEFIDRYNSSSASQQENMEEEKKKWDEWYEEKIEWISKYEETLATLNEKQNDLLETQNKISEAMLAKIQYKVEVKVDINKDEQDLLDYLSEKYDEVIEKQGVIMNNLIRESELAQDNIRALEQSRYELELAFNSGNINQADYVEGLRDINEQLLDNLKTINDVKKDIEELYSDTIEDASKVIDKQTQKINNASEAMKSYISILQLLGKGQNYEDLMYFYEKQYDYNKASLQTQMDLLEVLKQEEKYYLDRIDSTEGLTETEREQYEALQETMQDVQKEILSSTESTLQSLQEKYNNTINSIMKNLEESIVGEGNSLNWLSEEYSYYLEEFNRYLSAQKQLYEINKLNRNIDKSIADTTETLYRKQLKQLQDEINAKAESNSLSEYELNIMNLKYELLLKQIALEEAQNAKSTVRLTRDSEGNMIYQYTADADEISKAQQEYEDVLQQMVDANYEQIHNVEQQTIETYQNMVDKIKEIATDETLTQEQKMERIVEIVSQTKDTLRYLLEQYNITSENLMYANELVSERYNIALWEHSENAKNNMNTTIAEMIANTDKYVAEMQNACGNGGSIQSALEDYSTKVDEIAELTGTRYGDMIDAVQDYDRVTEDAEDETRKMANELRNNLLPQIHTTTNAWDTYYKTLRTSITQTEALISKNNALISSLAQITQAAQRAQSAIASVSSARVSTPYGSAGGSSSGGGGNNGSSGSGGTSGGSNINGYSVTVQGKGQTNTFKFATSQYGSAEAARGTASAYVSQLKSQHPEYKISSPIQYATGGLADYTGPAWLDGTKNKPELVLNPEDTQNMFRTIDAVRQLDKTTLNIMDDFINFATSSMMANMFNLHAGSTNGSSGELQQNVQITAEFPNVQDRNEIEAAFDNLINRASQFIGSKGRP